MRGGALWLAPRSHTTLGMNSRLSDSGLDGAASWFSRECRLKLRVELSPCRIGSVGWERKVLSEGGINQLVLPGTGQLLGVVTQMFGYDRIMAKCSDGLDRVAAYEAR